MSTEPMIASDLQLKFIEVVCADPFPISSFGKGGKGDSTATDRTNPPKSPFCQGGFQRLVAVKFLNELQKHHLKCSLLFLLTVVLFFLAPAHAEKIRIAYSAISGVQLPRWVGGGAGDVGRRSAIYPSVGTRHCPGIFARSRARDDC